MLLALYQVRHGAVTDSPTVTLHLRRLETGPKGQETGDLRVKRVLATAEVG